MSSENQFSYSKLKKLFVSLKASEYRKSTIRGLSGIAEFAEEEEGGKT